MAPVLWRRCDACLAGEIVTHDTPGKSQGRGNCIQWGIVGMSSHKPRIITVNAKARVICNWQTIIMKEKA